MSDSNLTNPKSWLQQWVDANRQRDLPPEPLPRRYGRFRIAGHFYRDLQGLTTLQRIMAEVVIVRCEYRHAEEAMLYHAWCPQWDEVAPGAVLPIYDPVVDTERGQVTWRAMV